MSDPPRVAVYTIPSHRSFADALAAGLMARFGRDPLGLARGRILLPNHRAVADGTDALVVASGAGLLLLRIIPIGDPGVEDQGGEAVDPLDRAPLAPVGEPSERLVKLALSLQGQGTAQSLRLADHL